MLYYRMTTLKPNNIAFLFEIECMPFVTFERAANKNSRQKLKLFHIFPL